MTTKQLALASVAALTIAAVAYGEAVPRELHKEGKAPKTERVIPAKLAGGHLVEKAPQCSARGCRDWKDGDPLIIWCVGGTGGVATTAAGLDKANEKCNEIAKRPL